MSLPRLYDDLAEWWPLASAPEEYAEEAKIIRAAFEEHLGPGRHTLLDLGVGGGHCLSHLTADFDATGVDLSPHMLDQSKRLNPGAEHHVGDMRQVRLQRTFDAILIHDAVAYMLSEADLRAVLATAAAHLAPGGVLVMCPDWFKEIFPDGFVSHKTRHRGDTSLTYMEYLYDPDPDDTTVEMVMFLLIRDAGGLRVEQDRHTMGVFAKATWLRVIAEAGFVVETRPYVTADYGAELELLVAVSRKP